jgi:hypothetical protein
MSENNLSSYLNEILAAPKGVVDINKVEPERFNYSIETEGDLFKVVKHKKGEQTRVIYTCNDKNRAIEFLKSINFILGKG